MLIQVKQAIEASLSFAQTLVDRASISEQLADPARERKPQLASYFEQYANNLALRGMPALRWRSGDQFVDDFPAHLRQLLEAAAVKVGEAIVIQAHQPQPGDVQVS